MTDHKTVAELLAALEMVKTDLDELISNGQNQIKESVGYKAICTAIAKAKGV